MVASWSRWTGFSSVVVASWSRWTDCVVASIVVALWRSIVVVTSYEGVVKSLTQRGHKVTCVDRYRDDV